MPTEHSKGTKNLEYALRYGEKLGLRVIPLAPGQKAPPLIPDWQNKATTDAATIRQWWTRWPDANIGIVTGEYRDGYFYVLDFDPRNGGDWWADVGEDILPETWTVDTPNGGRHFYYRSEELVRSEKLPHGVDLKGKGGYVVAPPSILIDEKTGEKKGEWDFLVGNMPKDMGLALHPKSGLDTLRKWGVVGGVSTGGGIILPNGGGGIILPSGGGGIVLPNGQAAGKSGGGVGSGRSLWLMPPPIPKGMRHDYLVSLAGAFWSAGLTEKEVEALLWAALELLETLADFEPQREIPNIVKGLQKWEGENYTIGSLLRRLPERTAAVVRRVVSGGVVSGEPVGEPVSEPVSEGADSGRAANTGQSEKRRVLASEIVSKLEVRKGADGTFRYVYRAADGTELEAACAPEGVRDLLAKLGVKIPLKEVKKVLGIVQGGKADAGEGEGEGEAKEKRGRKSKTTDKGDIKAVLARYKWVRWQEDLWLVTQTKKLLRADIDELHGLLKENGLDVGKETLKSYYKDIITDIPKDPLQGIVVTPEPTHGKVGNLRGLWFVNRGDLYLVTPDDVRIFARGQWPEGVYALDLGERGVLPDWDGEVKHILRYWEGITPRFEGNPLVALAMFLPVLFGQGHIGIILRGPAKSGKSTLLKGLAYLRLGRETGTPNSGANMRDLIAVLQSEQIVFFDEVNTFTNELQETLKRMITHDKTRMRALYTDTKKVETDLRGSAVFCTTNLEKLASDLRTRCFVWDLREKEGGAHETEILEFCAILWRLALAGAIRLYQQAAKLKPPPKNLLPQVRFRDWLSWAYRYAQVLGVEKEFVAFVAKSKLEAHGGDKYEFILDAIAHKDFDPNKEYTISELGELASLPASEKNRLRGAIGRAGVRADMIAVALDAGYNLRIEKSWVGKDRRDRYKFIFSPIEVSTNNRLREILAELGLAFPSDDDDDDGGAPTPPEPAPTTPTPPTPPPPIAPPPTPTPPPPPTPTPPPPPPPNNPPTPPDTPPVESTAATGTGADTATGATKDEPKTLTDMVHEKKTDPVQPMAGGSAEPNGLTENIRPEDSGLCAYIMDCIDRYEQRGKRADAIEWVEKYLNMWLNRLTSEGYTASIALLHSELERLKTGGVRQTGNGTPTPPPHHAAGESQTTTGTPTPPKTDPKKAPPPSEWVYRGGATPQSGGVSGGLFAPPQDAQTTPTATQAQTQTAAQPKTAIAKDEYPTDAELIAYIDKRLREQAEGGITLEGSLDFLNRFLLRFEEEMWQLELTKSLRYIQNKVIELQDAIKALGYDELTPEKDPRLRTPTK